MEAPEIQPQESAPASEGRVTVIDSLRGIASLAVCWYHLVFTSGSFLGGSLVAGLLRDSARNGWVGVEIFFVISGFVIPLALYRSQYTPRSFGAFMLKRIVRLEPPYLVSVVLCVVLWYVWAVVPRLHGPPFDPQWLPIFMHLGYLNAFFHREWLNPVYWTLAIEFQYYLGMGLIYVAVANRQIAVRYATFAALAVLALLQPDPSLVFHYLFIFMLGMVTFQYFVGLLPIRFYAPTLVALAIGCVHTLGPTVAVISVLTALFIAFVRSGIPVLGFLGTISYSLYLIHVPIGARILFLGLTHVHGGAARVLVLLVTLGLTIGAAYVFYLLVERPAQRWSAKVRYSRRATRAERVGMEPTGAAVSGIAEP